VKVTVFEPAFVEYAPKVLTPGVLYLALEHSTVVHLCACGCGTKVVTPLSPAQWRLTFDGDVVSLWPSIGNWQFPCRSHYWIRESAVAWADPMTDTEIAQLRQQDARERERYYARRAAASEAPPAPDIRPPWWRRPFRWPRGPA
jgi:hypothetical protein